MRNNSLFASDVSK